MWSFKKYPSRTAAVTPSGMSITYAQLDSHGDELCKTLPERSLGIILCRNEVGSLLGYTAMLRHRHVPLMLSADIDKELLRHFIELYHPGFIWLPDDRVNELSDFGEVPYTDYGYTLSLSRDKSRTELYPDLALLLTTSGSTGSPRIVRQSYKNLAANTASIIEYLGISSDERPVTALPMNYTFGLSIINTHLSVGATLLLTDGTVMQREFWDFVSRERATSLSGVPYTFQMLDRLRFQRRQLPDLKTLTQAGGRLSPELQDKFASYAIETGKKFVVMYGQSEATARMSYLPPERCLEKLGSVGIPIPGVDLCVIDDQGHESYEPNITGELVCHGDNVTLGYADCAADLNKGDEHHGVLHTGDLAYFDEDGYIHICGRKKRFLKIFGNRVNLDETEELIRKHFPDADCACAGQDDLLEIYLTDGNLSSQIQNFLAEITHLNFTAFKMIIIDKIPRNDSGKIRYSELKAHD